MFKAMEEASRQYWDGLITAGEYRLKLINALVEHAVELETVEDKELLKLATTLIGEG